MAERLPMPVLLGAALLAGCGEAAVPEKQAPAARAPQQAGPEVAAQSLVRQRLGTDEIRFGDTRAYRNGQIAVVCGSFARPGQPGQRFVAVSDVDVWLEPDMAPGQMDRAFDEFCKDGNADA